MADDNGDKRFPASERRRQKAREQGQIPRSSDLTSAGLLLAALWVISYFGPPMVEDAARVLVKALRDTNTDKMTVESATGILVEAGYFGVSGVGPIMFSMFIFAVLFNFVQTGPLLLPDKLMPKFSNVNPYSGIKRLLALPNLMRLGFGVFKLTIISIVALLCLRQWYQAVLGLMTVPLESATRVMIDSVFSTCLWIGAALFLLAAFDYAFQRWKHEQDLMMTEQEVRDEMKESQGDPQVIGKRRQLQRQMAMQRMQSDVPKADVVVTNPTELAIAIKYDPKTMVAPVVVAKGAGLLAQRIRRIALENGVAIVERKPLAQALYKTVDVGHPIPTEQYQAVAEVLKYVYQLEGRQVPNAA